jgi:hypothetical protein
MIPAASAVLTWSAGRGPAVAPGEAAVAWGEGAAVAWGEGAVVALGEGAIVADRRAPGVAGGREAAAGAAISNGACAARPAFSAVASVAEPRATTTTGEEPNSSRANSTVSTSGAVLASTDTAGDG